MSGSPIQPKWLTWSQQLQAIAQTGLVYAADPFDIERYEAVQEIAAQILSEYSGVSEEKLLTLFQGEAGHATPKVDARGVVIRDNAMLLVRESSDGLWTLPGGWVDPGESPKEAVEREIYEESGYLTHATKLLALYDHQRHGHPPFPYHVYKLFFLCELSGGEATTSHETTEIDFFFEDQIPTLSLIRVMPQQIQRFFAHYRHPDWPTDFD